jgi:hypothetical protein
MESSYFVFAFVFVFFGLFRLFRNGSKTPKQTEKIIFWFHETNRKWTETDCVSVCFGLFRFEPKNFLYCFEDTLTVVRTFFLRIFFYSCNWRTGLRSAKYSLYRYRKIVGLFPLSLVHDFVDGPLLRRQQTSEMVLQQLRHARSISSGSGSLRDRLKYRLGFHWNLFRRNFTRISNWN